MPFDGVSHPASYGPPQLNLNSWQARGLELWITFQIMGKSSLALDSSGHDRHGINHNGVLTSMPSRHGAFAGHFGAPAHCIRWEPADSAPQRRQTFTRSFWFAFHEDENGSIPGQQMWTVDQRADMAVGLSGLADGEVGVRYYDGAFDILRTNVTSWSKDEPHHLCWVRDENVGNWLYLDGALTDSNTDTAALIYANRNARFGVEYNFFSNTEFDGSIWDARLYNWPLNSGQVHALWHEESRLDLYSHPHRITVKALPVPRCIYRGFAHPTRQETLASGHTPEINWDSPLARGLVGWWPLHERPWRDASGQGHELVDMTPPPTVEPERIGRSTFFDDNGTTRGFGKVLYGASVPNPTSSNPQSIERTITAWIKLSNSTQTDAAIAGFFAYSFVQQYGLGLWYDNGTLYAIGEANHSNAALSASLTDTANWHHVAARFSTDGALFIDGKKVANGSLDDGWSYLWGIGGSMRAIGSQDNSNYFDGHIADVTLHHEPLTDSEIEAFYDPVTRWSLYSQLRRIASGPSGASTLTATASLNAALQAQLALTASVNAALQVEASDSVGLTAALQAGQTESLALDTMLQKASLAGASLDGALQAERTLQGNLEAALAMATSLTASLDVAARAERVAALSLSANLTVSGTIVANLAAALQEAVALEAGLSAALQMADQGLIAGLTAALGTSRQVTAACQTALASSNVVSASLEAVVHESVSLESGLGAFVQPGDSPIRPRAGRTHTGPAPGRLMIVPPSNRRH